MVAVSDVVIYGVHMGTYGDQLATAVAQQLQAERAAAGLTYDALGEACGIDKQSTMRYLLGRRPVNMERLGKFADALGVTPEEILKRAVMRIR